MDALRAQSTSSFPYLPALTWSLFLYEETQPFVILIFELTSTFSMSSFQRVRLTVSPFSSCPVASQTLPADPLQEDLNSLCSFFSTIVTISSSTFDFSLRSFRIHA